MSKSTTDTKKKLEHWELVTLLLMVYDFIAIWYLTLPHCGSALTADSTASRKSTCRPISAQYGSMQYSA